MALPDGQISRSIDWPRGLAAVAVPYRDIWSQVLDPGRHPVPGQPNGSVWPTLSAALWALRQTTSFDDALRSAINLGGDTDTIAAVTGGLAGAVYGIHAIPTRCVRALFVPLPGFGRTYTADEPAEARRPPGHRANRLSIRR